MRVTILQLEAKESLIQIKEYIIQDSVFYANKTIEEILKRIHNLEIFPYMGKQVEIKNKKMRQIIYKSYKYFINLNSIEFISYKFFIIQGIFQILDFNSKKIEKPCAFIIINMF